MKKLARDVAINVVANLFANLITVALVYLLGVATGLLPYSRLLVNGAILAISIATLPVAVGATIAKAVRPSLISKTREYRINLVSTYVACILLPLQIIYMTMTQERSGQSVIQLVLIAMIFACQPVIIWRQRRQQQRMKVLAEQQARRTQLRNPRASREPRIIRRQRLPQRTTRDSIDG